MHWLSLLLLELRKKWIKGRTGGHVKSLRAFLGFTNRLMVSNMSDVHRFNYEWQKKIVTCLVFVIFLSDGL